MVWQNQNEADNRKASKTSTNDEFNTKRHKIKQKKRMKNIQKYIVLLIGELNENDCALFCMCMESHLENPN